LYVSDRLAPAGGDHVPSIELSVGTIDYDDSGGDGPVVVLLHGNGVAWVATKKSSLRSS